MPGNANAVNTEASQREYLWQLQMKYGYLASLYHVQSVEREVYCSIRSALRGHTTLPYVAGIAATLQKRVKAINRRIADPGWKPEFRQQWREEVKCYEQVMADMRSGNLILWLHNVEQRIWKLSQ